MKKLLWLGIISLFLVSGIFAGGKNDSPAASAGGTGGLPSYLNPVNTYPIVKEGQNVTLSVANVYDAAMGGKLENLWFWKFIEKKTNIKFEVEMIMSTAVLERKNLMFASGDLKDIMWGLNLTTSELMQYGQSEHLLLDTKKYINKEITPNIVKAFEKYPRAAEEGSCLDGGIYSIVTIDEPEHRPSNRIQLNTAWLKKAGLSMPNTIDDLYNILKTFKEKDPSGTGRIIPLGGSYSKNSPAQYLLAAYGFVMTTTDVSEPAIRNGKVEIPAGSPYYKNYLAFMNKLYSEGLMDRNFFTLDQAQIDAQVSEKRVGLINKDVMYTMLPAIEDFQQYEVPEPLTSNVNPKKVFMANQYIAVGAGAIAAKCKYPEAAMRFMDYFYTVEGVTYQYYGPPNNRSQDFIGLLKEGYTWPTIPSGYSFDIVRNGTYTANAPYIHGNVAHGLVMIGERSNFRYCQMVMNETPGVDNPFGKNAKWDAIPVADTKHFSWTPYFIPTQGEDWVRITMVKNLFPYQVDTFPKNFYLSAEDNTRLIDLKTVILDFVDKESAKFITGVNSLANIDKYYSDLNALGFKEYQDIYTRAYEAYLKNAKK
jgi:putative aldouronate transport system substrate-binding protein